MEDNVYATPKADLVGEGSGENTFYVVSKKKFWLLFILTIGMYQLYWFYAHWKNYRNSSQESLWPIGRALFAVFFAHSLFGKIQKEAEIVDSSYSSSLTGTATLYVVLAICINLFGVLFEPVVGELIATGLPLLLIPLIGFPLANAQEYANVASSDPEGTSNSTMTGANIFWMIVGILYIALAAFGVYAIATGLA